MPASNFSLIRRQDVLLSCLSAIRRGSSRGGCGLHGLRLRQAHQAARRLRRYNGTRAIHLMNGLYNAAPDGAPVVALNGLTFHDLRGVRSSKVSIRPS